MKPTTETTPIGTTPIGTTPIGTTPTEDITMNTPKNGTTMITLIITMNMTDIMITKCTTTPVKLPLTAISRNFTIVCSMMPISSTTKDSGTPPTKTPLIHL